MVSLRAHGGHQLGALDFPKEDNAHPALADRGGRKAGFDFGRSAYRRFPVECDAEANRGVWGAARAPTAPAVNRRSRTAELGYLP